MSARIRIRVAFLFATAVSAPVVGCSTHSGAGTPDAPRPTTPANSTTSVEDANGKSTAELLEGRFPGVNVMRVAGGGIKVRVRQSGDFDGRGDPLYIIDGVPTEPPDGVLNIEPNEIARIEVLKDAASTSSYGLRGANGIVKITMKR
ncbi:MAG: TonB-dependent receptor plug domain-containing protein [Gemmatimonadaceae bacterium]|nr:TonB-dependent receptor plug domain-containing protein [Gemmatimonadaceae bacterium]